MLSKTLRLGLRQNLLKHLLCAAAGKRAHSANRPTPARQKPAGLPGRRSSWGDPCGLLRAGRTVPLAPRAAAERQPARSTRARPQPARTQLLRRPVATLFAPSPVLCAADSKGERERVGTVAAHHSQHPWALPQWHDAGCWVQACMSHACCCSCPLAVSKTIRT